MSNGVFLEFERREGVNLAKETSHTRVQVPAIEKCIDEIHLYCTMCEQFHWYLPGPGRGRFDGNQAVCPHCGEKGLIEFLEPI